MDEQEIKRREDVQELIDKIENDIKEIDNQLADKNLSENKRKKLEKKRALREEGLHDSKMSLEDPEYDDRKRQELIENSSFTKMARSMEKTGESMQSAGKDMQNAGSSMMNQGCLITLWVFAFPIIIPIWIIKKAFFDKKK